MAQHRWWAPEECGEVTAAAVLGHTVAGRLVAHQEKDVEDHLGVFLNLNLQGRGLRPHVTYMRPTSTAVQSARGDLATWLRTSTWTATLNSQGGRFRLLVVLIERGL